MSQNYLLRKQVSAEVKKKQWIFFTVIFLSFLFLFITFMFGESGYLKYMKLKNKKTQLGKDIKNIEAKNTALKADLKLLKENPFYLEKYARENFGMAKPDEYVFTYDDR